MTQQNPLIFASNNAHKLEEIRSVLGSRYTISGLKESGIFVEIPEPYNSLEENARAKSDFIFQLTGKACFSEDTGLEVEALDGAPGVKSARYAGENATDAENVLRLLHEMAGKPIRTARFRTVISLQLPDQTKFFEGICTGKILETPRGTGGFGYDSLFIPDGADRSFAEMTREEKNQYSHRRKAMDQCLAYLTQPDGTR